MENLQWDWLPIEKSPIKIIDGDRGKNYPKLDEFFEDEYCLFLNTGNVTKLGFNFEKKQFITESKDNLLRKGKLIKGDIVLTTRGTVGNVAYFDESVPFEQIRINSGMVILRNTNSDIISTRFIYQFFRSFLFINQIYTHFTGSAQPQLPIKDLQQIRIPIPPLDSQEKIADILGTLDDKIELNRQMNQTLESMARAIFKSWFVDFDPVYAKMEGRDYPLPPEIMDLFPDELEESEVGLIPMGWRVTPFGNLIDFHSGGDWGKEEENVNHRIATRIIRGTDIPELTNLGLGKVPIRFLKPESFRKRKIESGDIIIEISGGSNDQPTGRSLFFTNSLLDRFTLPIAPTSFCRLLRPINLRLAVLLSVHLRIIYDKGIMWNYQNRSTGISNFQTNYFLENEKVVIPSDDLLEKFFQIVFPILVKMQSNESISLQKLRNYLLPKLLSGDIEL